MRCRAPDCAQLLRYAVQPEAVVTDSKALRNKHSAVLRLVLCAKIPIILPWGNNQTAMYTVQKNLHGRKTRGTVPDSAEFNNSRSIILAVLLATWYYCGACGY